MIWRYDMKSYTVYQNSIKIIGEIMKEKKSARWEIPIRILADATFPLLNTFIPSVVISLIMEGSLSKYLWVMLGLIILTGILDMTIQIESARVRQMAMITRCGELITQLLCKVMRTDYVNVEPYERQKEIGRASRSIGSNVNGPEALANDSISFVVKVLGILTYGSAILLLDVRIFLITILMFVLNYFFCRHACQYTDKRREEVSEGYRKWRYLWRSALTLEPGKDVRVFQMEKWFHRIGDGIIEIQRRIKYLTELRWYLPTISDQLCIFARDLLAYTILLNLVLNHTINVATFTLYIGVIAGFSNWMNTLALSVSSLRRFSHEYNDYRTYMEREDVPCHGEGLSISQPDEAPEVEFRDVSFHYDGDTTDVLRHVSFKLRSGDKLALVGNNGAGKTTLVKLLCGLYQPTEGAIYLNGKDICSFNINEYQKLISVLFQDINLTAFTIAMNVAGCPERDIDETRVEQSLKRAGLWEKVESLPEGMHTYISQTINENGVDLSGGERQKLLLARAMYKNGPLLILDEPTSALDPLAESKMYEEYNEMTLGKTSIFISHRLASTKFCSQIFFMKDGTLAESGTHEQLIKANGEYAKMYELQSHYYKEGVNADEFENE